MTFEDFSLDSTITAAIRSAGYTSPTLIQRKAIPVVTEGRDVLGIAQTGTGKTAAFVLPVLQRLIRRSSRKPRALIIAPTRELAKQIHQSMADLARYNRIERRHLSGFQVAESTSCTHIRLVYAGPKCRRPGQAPVRGVGRRFRPPRRRRKPA